MWSRELQTLLNMEFTGTRIDVHGPVGVRFPRVLAAVNCSGRPPAAVHRMVYAAIRARAAGQASALSLRDLTAVEARNG